MELQLLPIFNGWIKMNQIKNISYDYFKVEGDSVEFFEKKYTNPIATLTLEEVFAKAHFLKN